MSASPYTLNSNPNPTQTSNPNSQNTPSTQFRDFYPEIRPVVFRFLGETIYPEELGARAYLITVPSNMALCYDALTGGYFITTDACSFTVYYNERTASEEIVVIRRSGVHMIVKKFSMNQYDEAVVDVRDIIDSKMKPYDYPIGFYSRLVKLVKKETLRIINGNYEIKNSEHLRELAWIIVNLFIDVAERRRDDLFPRAIVMGWDNYGFPLINRWLVKKVVEECFAPAPGKANLGYADLAYDLAELIIIAIPLLKFLYKNMSQ